MMPQMVSTACGEVLAILRIVLVLSEAATEEMPPLEGEGEDDDTSRMEEVD